MERYSWTYIIAPLKAATFAGLLARFHLKALNKNFDGWIRKANFMIKFYF